MINRLTDYTERAYEVCNKCGKLVRVGDHQAITTPRLAGDPPDAPFFFNGGFVFCAD